MTEPATPFKVKSIFEYKSEFEDDLTFPIGKIITVIEVEDDEWFSGELDGKTGMFPKNFVEILPVEPAVPVPTSRPTPKKTVSSAVVAPIVTQTAKQVEPDHNKPISPTSPSVEARRSSIGSGVKVPLPYQSNQRVADPYSIKKQFVAAGHSSYVPQIKPRDDSNIISHALHDVTTDDKDIVKSTPVSEKQIEHEEEPKVSLKDRIALLQKQQQEEAEREIASLKKKEEKKKRQDEAKETTRHRNEVQEAELASQKSGDNESLSRRRSIDSVESMRRQNSIRDEFIQEHGEDIDEVEEDVHPEAELKEEEEEEEEEEVEEEDGDDGEAEDEESEDEESKRRKLVERMAKISGGRNMFGMMGMASPFGAAPPPAATEKATKPKKKTTKAVESVQPSEPTEAPKSIPIIPKVEESQHPKLRESSSMVEEDSDSDDRYVEVENPTVNLDSPLNNPSGPISKQIIEASDSGIDDIKKPTDQIKITRHATEPEATGYEADEDLSDLKTNTIDSDIEIPPPPPPTKNTSTPLKKEVDEDEKEIEHRPPPPPIPSLPSSVPPVPPVPQVPAAPPPVSSRPPPPAPPTSHLPPPPVPPIPPVPSRGIDEREQDIEEEDESEEEEEEDTPVLSHQEISHGDDDDEFAFTPAAPTRASTAPTHFAPPPIPPIPTSIPPVPSTFVPPIPSNYPPAPEVVRRASTEVFHQAPLTSNSTGASIGSRQSLDSGSRSRSSKTTKSDQSQAELVFDELHEEVNINTVSNQQWWLNDELPDKLTSKIGNDLIFEIDKNSIGKRGSRQIEIKDYYILFYDLSQIVIELQYETRDPRSTVKLVNFFIKPIPIVRKDLLDRYHRNFSSLIVNAASQYLGQKLSDNIVKIILDSPQTSNNTLLHTIGNKSFGVTIYKSLKSNSNATVERIDDIKAGDILWIKNGKFQSHKGLVGSKSISTGDEHTSIIYEYDNSNKKEKLRVIETDAAGNVKRETYKLSEFKSGRIRIFRPVGKDYIGWN
ncbi:hypothetical protein DFJ63DRAFT_153153 [Scheffersomyces coipomensis]|uniref:uncharacterized protein n=1 Tax=Scheffersomyces coipomensis TaxID=1788519 RepID=UPI00315D729E